MELNGQFSSDFRALNRAGAEDGPEPLKWQIRLFEQLCANEVPRVCDLPTGMGKTSIIHLWLLALRHQKRENKPRLPTRLVYVVDRRTVVDQATELAECIKSNLGGLGLPEDWLSVSTLRGQLADNRDWAKDPSRPAIIIGTVDMIGSRLLFSGYRSSFKLRPLDAGLLGQDALLVLDEAHLSEPFERLLRAIDNEGKFQRDQGLPVRVMCMSATAGADAAGRFRLECTDLEGSPESNPIVQRYEAKKRLVIAPPMDKAKVEAGIIEAATALAKDNSRVVVFVQKPEVATKIEIAIGKKLKRFEKTVEVLTGTMRGLERDELLEKPVLKRFLDGKEQPIGASGKQPAILVSTSAGEVGFDLNADHMVCDAAPLDSMIQRLGRVNRRGYGTAEVRVFVSDDKKPKGEERPKGKHTWASATAAAVNCLNRLAQNEDGTRNASPKALDHLKAQLTKDRQLDAALSPKPEAVELTDILLDAWSMTSIVEPMPGRPPVAPWLRGLSEGEQPDTTIAWRTELDLDGFGRLDIEEIEEWFDAHRVLPHETLTVPTSVARDNLLARWDHLGASWRAEVGERPCVIDRAGLRTVRIKDLMDELERKRTGSILGADVVLPASFGGIERGKGLLDENAPDLTAPRTNDSAPDPRRAPDVADVERGRFRQLRTVGDDVQNEEWLAGGAVPNDSAKFSLFRLDLPAEGDVRRQLVSWVPKREWPEFGTERQSLDLHVGLVEKYAREIADRLSLADDVREALWLAAKFHDKGKNRPAWQRAVHREPGEEPVGKSGGSMDRIPGGYRHEFGSLREFADEHEDKIASHVFDLAMHLIATHHGRGRPHFPKGGFDPEDRAQSERIATETIRRFARLQRRYGYWRLAWLENLLRCADTKASAEKTAHL